LNNIWPFEDSKKIQYLNKDKINKRVYKIILYEILSGEYESGDKVLIKNLTKKYDVSTTPIREALSKLKNEGILEKSPYKSYKVKGFSVNEIESLFEARIILETQAIKLASRRINKENKNKFQEILKNGAEFVKNKDSGGFNKNNAEFHFCIFETSKNKYLYDMMENLYKQIMLLTFRSFSNSERPKKSLEDHNKLYKYLIQGEEEKGIILVKEHLNRSMRKIKNVI